MTFHVILSKYEQIVQREHKHMKMGKSAGVEPILSVLMALHGPWWRPTSYLPEVSPPMAGRPLGGMLASEHHRGFGSCVANWAHAIARTGRHTNGTGTADV